MLLCVRRRARAIRPRVPGTGLPHAVLRSDRASGHVAAGASAADGRGCGGRVVSAVGACRIIARQEGHGADSRGRIGARRICVSSVRTGDVLRPIIRRNDRAGEPKPGGIQVLDWTYLLVREPQEYLLDCDVYSAMRNPLAGAVRRRWNAWRSRSARTARRRRSNWSPGTMPTAAAGRLRDLCQETARRGRRRRESVAATRTDGLARHDRHRTSPICPLRLIYVKNGAHLVARIPVVPGYRPLETVPLASDDKRLEAEAFVKGMESTVMDLVARREILAARIRRASRRGSSTKHGSCSTKSRASRPRRTWR